MPDSASTPAVSPRHEEALRALADVPREPGVSKPEPILVADHVKRSFGGLTAVDVDHVEIQRGSITALRLFDGRGVLCGLNHMMDEG